MSALAALAFVYGCTAAVWAGTRQRFGTSDEARTLAAAIEATIILGALGAVL